MLTEINLGNGLKTTYGYYGTGGTYDTSGGYYGRLWEIKTLPQAGGNALQDVRHTWDAGGNLSTREDVLASETETFTASICLRELRCYQEDEADNVLSVEKQIYKQEQRIKGYDNQEKNLVKLFRYGEIDENHILDELEHLKQERLSDEENLTMLREAQGKIDHLTRVEKKLKAYCEQVRETLKELTFSEKRIILDELDVKVIAAPEDLQIKASIPLELTTVQAPDNFITTVQTWA
jgi:hypothetical protein